MLFGGCQVSGRLTNAADFVKRKAAAFFADCRPGENDWSLCNMDQHSFALQKYHQTLHDIAMEGEAVLSRLRPGWFIIAAAASN